MLFSSFQVAACYINGTIMAFMSKEELDSCSHAPSCILTTVNDINYEELMKSKTDNARRF